MKKHKVITGNIEFTSHMAIIHKVYQVIYTETLEQLEQVEAINDAAGIDYLIPDIFRGEIIFKNNNESYYFPCGINSWIITHTEMVRKILEGINVSGSIGQSIDNLMEVDTSDIRQYLARKWTQEFEELHITTSWKDTDFFEAIEQFVRQAEQKHAIKQTNITQHYTRL